MRTGLVFAVAVVVVVFGAAPVALAQEAPTFPESPPGELLIVNNNLEEALVAEDVQDPTDMQNFVNRLLPQVVYAPDVLILQEIVSTSAANVAAYLTEATGYNYDILISPGETVYPYAGEGEPEQIIRDSGILINTDTVAPVGPSGFVQTRYAAEDGLPGEPVRVKEHAYAAVTELQSGTQIPLMSLHFVPNRNSFTDEEVGFTYKDRWSDEMAEVMAQTFSEPGWAGPIVAGDFNNRRCPDPDETRDCAALPFWVTMTSEHTYTDGIFDAGSEAEIGTRKRIDYMFARLPFLQAASDLTYGDIERSDPATFYSDHRLMWAVAGVS